MGVTRVLTVKEAAEALKTTRQQIRRMIQSGELPAVKVGREWRIPEESVETFLMTCGPGGRRMLCRPPGIFSRGRARLRGGLQCRAQKRDNVACRAVDRARRNGTH